MHWLLLLVWIVVVVAVVAVLRIYRARIRRIHGLHHLYMIRVRRLWLRLRRMHVVHVHIHVVVVVMHARRDAAVLLLHQLLFEPHNRVLLRLDLLFVHLHLLLHLVGLVVAELDLCDRRLEALQLAQIRVVHHSHQAVLVVNIALVQAQRRHLPVLAVFVKTAGDAHINRLRLHFDNLDPLDPMLATLVDHHRNERHHVVLKRILALFQPHLLGQHHRDLGHLDVALQALDLLNVKPIRFV
mmetsp:Transcript_30076/g.48077  ORF Transcript_30076/g.48077 Transcript_30076/m.48077 type:complete len:241 (-) Transcript_30076:740-1462(-)